MTVKELIYLSLEDIEAFEIDLGTYTKPLHDDFYNIVANQEIETYYLSVDKDTNQPKIIIKLKDY